ncbi:MAG: hypothetical protein JO290_14270 [Sphingomonadaceae bacterium]|nr:hypothetical protein [Sphingomonadaceae bacterium]
MTRKVAVGALAVAATATGIWMLSDYRAWAALTGGDWRGWARARMRRRGAAEPAESDVAAPNDSP